MFFFPTPPFLRVLNFAEDFSQVIFFPPLMAVLPVMVKGPSFQRSRTEILAVLLPSCTRATQYLFVRWEVPYPAPLHNDDSKGMCMSLCRIFSGFPTGAEDGYGMAAAIGELGWGEGAHLDLDLGWACFAASAPMRLSARMR